jgi:hypothetical protein
MAREAGRGAKNQFLTLHKEAGRKICAMFQGFVKEERSSFLKERSKELLLLGGAAAKVRQI